MGKLKISGKQLRALGYPQGPVISVAINTLEKNYKHNTTEEALTILKNILAEPSMFIDDAVLGNIAKMLLPKDKPVSNEIEC